MGNSKVRLTPERLEEIRSIINRRIVNGEDHRYIAKSIAGELLDHIDALEEELQKETEAMTINEKALMEAARAIFNKDPGYGLKGVFEANEDNYVGYAKAAIEAYEAALWRPASEAPENIPLMARSVYDHPLGGARETYSVCVRKDGNWWEVISDYSPEGIVTHFRPLPTFKEQE